VGPRRVASLGERTGVWALWALAWVLAAVRRLRKGSWVCMAKRTVAARAAVRMEISMTGDDSGLGVA
jgi:hypothetical protein